MTDALRQLWDALYAINADLWVIEDDIRAFEAKSDFGSGFIALARAVYVTNDERARVKKEINLLLGSQIVEEKSYYDFEAKMTIEDRMRAARKALIEVQSELVAKLATERSRARGGLTRQLHEVRGMLSATFPFTSQAGQDLVVDRIMQQKQGGTFVDVGAYDGVTGSNTLFFERHRDWTGVLVEPVAVHRAKAEQVRKAPCFEYAVADKKGTAEFMAVTEGYTQMSGLVKTYDPRMLDRVRADKRHVEKMINVPTRSLSQILEEAGMMNPDFVSLDIEGGELAALRKFPFDKHDVKVWSIENNSGDSALPALMREKGYELIEFCGPDEIYSKGR